MKGRSTVLHNAGLLNQFVNDLYQDIQRVPGLFNQYRYIIIMLLSWGNGIYITGFTIQNCKSAKYEGEALEGLPYSHPLM